MNLSDIRVVGSLVYARATDWESLADADRKRFASSACKGTKKLGFSGLVLFDSEGEVVSTCAPQGRRAASSTEGGGL